MLNLDTHIVVDLFSGELTKSEWEILRHAPLGISAIVIWEVARLHELGRISVGLQHQQFRQLLGRLHVWEIDAEVCQAMVEQLDFESDPADELIAATSLVHAVPLVTRDRKLRNSKVIPLATLPAT
jgi:PIN domain nuclease of toxin-antitoxin system